jgi:hypothetical protein
MVYNSGKYTRLLMEASRQDALLQPYGTLVAEESIATGVAKDLVRTERQDPYGVSYGSSQYTLRLLWQRYRASWRSV